MLLRDLTAVPGLRIRALYADDEALARPVGWAYTTDLLNPSRYLSRGQLVLTGLMWRGDASDSDSFVATVTAAGATALLAGEGLYGFVPDDVVEACRRHGLPLFAVPPEVSFAEITEHLAGAAVSDRVTRLTAGLVRQRQLLAEIAEGKALDELALQVSRETGFTCSVLTATGRQLLRGGPALPDEDVDRITTLALSTPHLPAVTSEPPYSVFPVGAAPGGREDRLTAWFVVVAGDRSRWITAVDDAFVEFAAIAGLDRARREQVPQGMRDVVDEAVGRIEHESSRPETAVYLRQAGVAPDQPLVVVVAELPGRPDVARWVLADAVAELGAPVVGTDGAGLAVALVPADDDEVVSTGVRRSLTRLAPGLSGTRLTAGVSRVTTPGAVGGALRSARHARLMGGRGTGPVQVTTSAEVASAVLLASMVPDDVRATYTEQVLGPVLEYDARNEAGLLTTLRAYFDCSTSWSRTAAHLHLHLNTVRYRILRVEELTGRDLSTMSDRADVYLALKLL